MPDLVLLREDNDLAWKPFNHIPLESLGFNDAATL
jgi:hypothetical protein